MASSNETPLSSFVKRRSKAIVRLYHRHRHARPLLPRLSHSLSEHLLASALLAAICVATALPSRGDELSAPIKKSTSQRTTEKRASSPPSGRPANQTSLAQSKERLAKRQEDLPAPRSNNPAFDDPFQQGDAVQAIPDQSMEGWFDDGGTQFGEFSQEDCGWVPCRMYGRVESLWWWVQGFSAPPLVTTSPAGTDRTVAGQLDQATTTILFPNDHLADVVRPGGRVRLGHWLNDCQTHGVEASYLWLTARSESFQATSTGDPILARPFFNVEPGFEGQDAELIAFPGSLEGSVTVEGESSFQAGEVLYRHAMCRGRNHLIDFLIGWRYSELNDDLTIRDSRSSIGAGGVLALGTTVDELDHFGTQNVFNGGTIGVICEKVHCDWTMELIAKVALGNTRSQSTIDGSTTVSVPVPGGAPNVAVTPAGLLAQNTNIGVRSTDEFTVIPELGVTVGHQVARNCRVTLGYTVLYWNQVTRPGDLIDTQLNLSQLDPGGLVGPAHPAFTQTSTGLWVQGLSLGFDAQF